MSACFLQSRRAASKSKHVYRAYKSSYMNMRNKSHSKRRSLIRDKEFGTAIGFLLAISLFFIPYVLRIKYMPAYLCSLNYIAIFVLAILVLYMMGYSYKINRQVSKVVLSAILILIILANYNHLTASVYLSIITPISILLIVVPETIYPSLFKGFYKGITLAIAVILICAIFDVISSHGVSRYIARFYGTPSLISHAASGRLISIEGHSLLTAEIALIYYILDQIGNRQELIKTNQVVVSVVAITIIAFTGSRSGLFAIMFAITISNLNVQNFKYLSVIVVTLLFMHVIGIFDIIQNRIALGLASGDMTSSRNIQLDKLISNGTISFDLLTGHEFDYANTDLIIALEYPLLLLAYRYGILFSITIAAVVMVVPIVFLLRRKQLFFAGLLLIYFFHINTYSSISTTQDGMLTCVIVVFLFLGMSRIRHLSICKAETT